MKSDVEDLMPRLLPIECGDRSAVLNLDGPPRNPQEYLRQVQLEAALCPEVVVAQIDPKKLKKQQTANISVAECHAAPAGFSPSLDWQQRQVSNFSDVRQSITRNRQHWSSHSLDDNVLMPKQADEEGWKRFCLGELVHQGTSPSHSDAEAGLDYSKVGFPPFLSIVSRLSQSTVLTVLDILISWFEERDFVPQLLERSGSFHTLGPNHLNEWSPAARVELRRFPSSMVLPPASGMAALDCRRGRWLYALLACLEKPLLPEAHSSIRQLARRCAQLRSNLASQDDDNLPALNLLVCLVARYFEQNDLADQPE